MRKSSKKNMFSVLVIVFASIGSIAVTQGDFIGIPEEGENDKAIESKTFNQNQDRIYSISKREVQDHAGNTGTATEEIITIKIDKDLPIYSGLSCHSWGDDYNYQELLESVDEWVNQNLECSYALSDPNPDYNSQLLQWQSSIGSYGGVGTAETWLVDKINQDTDETIEFKSLIQEQKRNYKIDGIIKDYAQNQLIFEEPLNIKIDKTPPSITEIQCEVCTGELVGGECPEDAEKTPYLGTEDDPNFSLGWSNKAVYCYYTADDQDLAGEYNYNSKLEYWGHKFKTQSGTGGEEGWEME